VHGDFPNTLHEGVSRNSRTQGIAKHTTPNIRVSTLLTSTQLRATWYTDSLDMVVLPSTGTLRYNNCCTDGGPSPEYFVNTLVKDKVIPLQAYGRLRLPDSVTSIEEQWLVTWCAPRTTSLETHNILSTAPQFSISQKALETLPADGNVMPKHVGATIHY
jgi:hypothetical protein